MLLRDLKWDGDIAQVKLASDLILSVFSSKNHGALDMYVDAVTPAGTIRTVRHQWTMLDPVQAQCILHELTKDLPRG